MTWEERVQAARAHFGETGNPEWTQEEWVVVLATGLGNVAMVVGMVNETMGGGDSEGLREAYQRSLIALAAACRDAYEAAL